MATLNRKPVRLTLDGQPTKLDLVENVLRLPPGRHKAVIAVE
jgi:hypothetical protein